VKDQRFSFLSYICHQEFWASPEKVQQQRFENFSILMNRSEQSEDCFSIIFGHSMMLGASFFKAEKN